MAYFFCTYWQHVLKSYNKIQLLFTGHMLRSGYTACCWQTCVIMLTCARSISASKAFKRHVLDVEDVWFLGKQVSIFGRSPLYADD
jgi:hypothetical protein